MRRLRHIALAAALMLGGWQAAMAENLTISGLGTLPLGDTVSVTDGKDNVLGDLFKKETKTKGYGKTAKAAMWSILAVPPGMNMYPEKGPYPYDSLHMYQLVKKNVQGTYTAAVMVFSGTEDDFFHEGRGTPFSGGTLSGRMQAGPHPSSVCQRYPPPNSKVFWTWC